ncbi:hypothetical protein Tcan_04077 [Toxocara canis]|uniref:Uncharacterized protein n=1 Tax=Toxocara canis TaxID=6265 RepID=A0A0B2V624_TOXCA|nr:hypothetical protein Tcan_04077 [Toxocara canis]
MSAMWRVLLLYLVGAVADEVEDVVFHEIPSKVDLGMAPNSSITCEDSTGLIYPQSGFGWRICFERSKCFPAFEKISKDRALSRKILNYFSQMTQEGPVYIRNICYLYRLEVSLRKSEKVLKWHWVCSNEARAKRRFFEDFLFCDRNPMGTGKRIFSISVSNGKPGSGRGEGKTGGKGKQVGDIVGNEGGSLILSGETFPKTQIHETKTGRISGFFFQEYHV